MIRVMLIEDNPGHRARIQDALAPREFLGFLEPFEFFAAGSLGAALHALRECKADVILLDLGLPDSREFDGIDRLRSEFPLVPIIVLTGQLEDTIIGLEAVKRGAQDYFSKSQLGEMFALERVIRYAIERKKNEQDLIVAREEALRASRAKSEFLSSMSHDIRTPLNCIVGIADLLARANLNEENANHVRMIGRASENLLSLINNILDLSKIESGRLKMNRRPFNLLTVLEGALQIAASKAHTKNLEVILNIASDVPRGLIGDADKLNQILGNLLSNAVKFTKAGEITLDISNVGSGPGRAVLRFRVEDTGIGIPNDKLSTIFESFTQLEEAAVPSSKEGSGLGLAICKRLIDMLGGTVHVQSVPGKGSRFEIEMPFDLSQTQLVTSLHPDLKNMHVLVTDDNQTQAETLREILHSWGASVHVAHSANEAEYIMNTAKEKMDFALLDLRLPGIASGGLDLSARIGDKVKKTIMMLPTNHRGGDLDRIKQAGIAAYLFKPVHPEKLAEVISGVDRISGESRIDPASATAPPLNLLVADDSEDNRYIIQAYCKNTGFKLELAENGQQAVKKFKEGRFDLVLLDIQMPVMSGYEALSSIREWEKSRGGKPVPILALTAFALKEEAERCLAAGFGAHITKPFKRDDLIKTIRKFAA